MPHLKKKLAWQLQQLQLQSICFVALQAIGTIRWHIQLRRWAIMLNSANLQMTKKTLCCSTLGIPE